jgi:hypothetical protein
MSNEKFNALYGAITAAEAATQATFALWQQMSPEEQEDWLAEAGITWPRCDIFLKTLLPASGKMIADERAADRLG